MRVGVGVAVASQNMSTVSPSFWISRLGDASPSTGGAVSRTKAMPQLEHIRCVSSGNNDDDDDDDDDDDVINIKLYDG